MDTKRWVPVAVIFLLAVGLLVTRGLPRGGSSHESKGESSGAYLSEPKPELLESTLGPAPLPLVSTSEHIESSQDAALLLRAMDTLGIRQAWLLGSPRHTFDPSADDPLGGGDANNEVILAAAQASPGRFLAFPYLDPTDPTAAARFEALVARGAAGLRLTLGRGGKAKGHAFHSMALDDPRAAALYRLCEQRGLPLVMDVNLGRFGAELERVLAQHPKLRVLVTHWGVSKSSDEKLARLEGLLQRHPGLYLGASFGGTRWQIEGFETLARRPGAFRGFLERNAGRVAFAGSATVSTDVRENYALELLRSYRQLFEMSAFRFYQKPERVMRGLELKGVGLEGLYVGAAGALLGK